MKKLSKVLALMLSLVLMLSMVACGESATSSKVESTATSSSTKETSSETSDETNSAADLKVGIIQLAEHTALDAAREGFVETMLVKGFKEENLMVQNAQGEQSNCGTIVTKFVNDEVDLILAIATPAAQAAAQATKEIPILVTAVTDPQVAGLVDSNEAPGRNVSGTSDMNPIDKQIDLMFKFVPEAKTIGLVYCSSEDNSILQAEEAAKAIEAKGAKTEVYTAADTSEIQAVLQSAVGKVDAIYIPTDNLFASNMATVALVTNPNKIPVFCGESGMVKDGGLATYGLSYKSIGVQTANQAIDILLNGADITTMPVGYSPVEDLELTINEEVAKEIGIEIPKDLE